MIDSGAVIAIIADHEEEIKMATLTIRNLDDDIRDHLRVRAACNGRSMEDEVRVLLRSAMTTGLPSQVWQKSRELFSDDNGIILDVPERSPDRQIPDFS